MEIGGDMEHEGSGGDWRADDLVLVRESSTGRHQLQGMADQAHVTARCDGLDELKAAAIRPMTEPEAFDAEVFAGPGRRLVLFPAAGTDHRTWEVLAVASAAHLDEDVQWFSSVFESILERLRPRRLWLPSAGRLARNLCAGSQTLRAIERHVDTVVLGGSPVAVGPQNPNGTMQLSFAITFAAAERDELVRRNVQGKVTAVGQRGRFIGGPSAVPLGYRLDGHGALEPDTDAGPVLELAARLLADPANRPRDVAEAMRRAGVRPPGRGSGRGWSWDDAAVARELDAARACGPEAGT